MDRNWRGSDPPPDRHRDASNRHRLEPHVFFVHTRDFCTTRDFLLALGNSLTLHHPLHILILHVIPLEVYVQLVDLVARE